MKYFRKYFSNPLPASFVCVCGGGVKEAFGGLYASGALLGVLIGLMPWSLLL